MNDDRSVCLCGSTKFMAEYKVAERAYALAGWRVHTVSIDGKDPDAKPITEGQKLVLDAVHMGKIFYTARTHFLNVGGYVGESSMREIAFALQVGRQVTFMEPLLRHKGMAPNAMLEAFALRGRGDRLGYTAHDDDELLSWIGEYDGGGATTAAA